MNVLKEITNKLNKINNKIFKIIFVYIILNTISLILVYLMGNFPLLCILLIIALIITISIEPYPFEGILMILKNK